MKLSASDVHFHEASLSQRETSWRQNGVSWAKPLSIEDYIVREKGLSETEIGTNGGNKYWFLTRIDAPEDVVCACETTRKVVLCEEKVVIEKSLDMPLPVYVQSQYISDREWLGYYAMS
jgi:hypothetical protein